MRLCLVHPSCVPSGLLSVLRRAVMISIGCALGAAAWAEDAPRLQPSADGASVIDTRSGLVWSRCVEGMTWDGKTCKGRALLLTHAEAQARAAERKSAEALPWRLPRVMDLKRLMDGRPGASGIDEKLFPATPAELHWASTANVRAPRALNPYTYGNVMRGTGGDEGAHLAFLHGWAVDMLTGEADGAVPKRTKLVVRLVRSTKR